LLRQKVAKNSIIFVVFIFFVYLARSKSSRGKIRKKNFSVFFQGCWHVIDSSFTKSRSDVLKYEFFEKTLFIKRSQEHKKKGDGSQKNTPVSVNHAL